MRHGLREVIVTADLHFHRHSIDSFRLEDGLATLDAIFEYAKKERISQVFILGDVFHSRNRLDAETLFRVFRHFFQWRQEGFGIHLLPGNHCWADRRHGFHTLEMFRPIASVFDEPSVLDLGVGWEFLFIPFCETRKEFEEALNKGLAKLKNKGIAGKPLNQPILLIHQGLDGFRVGSNYILEQDFKMEDLKPDLFALIISGHYHKYQRRGRFYYCGSPYQLNFGERDNVPGFLRLSIGGHTLRVKHVELEVAPRFIRLDAGEKVTREEVQSNFVQVTDESLLEDVKAYKPRKVVYSPKARKMRVEKRLDVKHDDPIEKVLGAYVKKAGKLGQRKKLLNLGQEILSEAQDSK